MNIIGQPERPRESIRLRSVKKLLANHQHLFRFIFANTDGDLRAEPDKLLRAAGCFSHSEIVLVMITLDICRDVGGVTLTEIFETLDDANWRQFIAALNALGEVYDNKR